MIKRAIVLLGVFCISAFCQSTLPKLLTANSEKLFSLRNAFQSGEIKNTDAIKYLLRQADKFLDITATSVVDKKQTPPSGDKHDYMSMSKYWWPNPDSKNGLPYIRKDGQVNPESQGIPDASNIGRLISIVEVLSIASFITSDQNYSSKAAELLRTWFIDEKNKMNPNLNFAQYVAGKNEGTKSGIIDTHNFYKLLDSITLLEKSSDWRENDSQKIKKWFSDYLNWLQTSKNGIDESKSKNNHGSWYDVQVVALLLFFEKNSEAKMHLENYTMKHIAYQIKEDGSQPEELVRTNGMSYSLFNIKALMCLALLGEKVGLDLWNYKVENGGTIKQALDYLLPFVVEPDKWNYQQISKFKVDDLGPVLMLAQKKYNEKVYSDWYSKIFGEKVKFSIEYFL